MSCSYVNANSRQGKHINASKKDLFFKIKDARFFQCKKYQGKFDFFFV